MWLTLAQGGSESHTNAEISEGNFRIKHRFCCRAQKRQFANSNSKSKITQCAEARKVSQPEDHLFVIYFVIAKSSPHLADTC